MNHRSVALRLLAVFVTAGLVLTTGLVTASALSGSVEDPAVVSVDETPDAGAADDSDKADDKAAEKAKDKADDDAGDEADDDADDESDANSDDDVDEGAPADKSDGASHEGHGSEISTLARSTEPGPLHGSVVCTAASGGKCQQDHPAADAGATEDADGGSSKGRGKGLGKGHAASKGKSRP